MTHRPFPRPIDYVNLDQAGFEARLKEGFSTLYPNVDLSTDAEMTVHLLGANAQVGDRLAYYLRRNGTESRAATAVLRASLLVHARTVGYHPRGISAAISPLQRFSLTGPAASPVTIPAGTIIRSKTDASIKFRTLEQAEIGIGETSVLAPAEHSELWQDTDTATGKAYYAYTAARTPYVDRSMVVETAAGEWTEVFDNFKASLATDRHFTTVTNTKNVVTIRFGDGINGAIPNGTVTYTYKTGGGSKGQLDADTLTVLNGVFYNDLNAIVAVTTTNEDITIGGDGRESDGSIRLGISSNQLVQQSATARNQYEEVAERTAGVARALMLTRTEYGAVPFNEGLLSIVPTSGGVATQELLNAVAARFGDAVYVGNPDDVASAPPTRFPRGDKPKTASFQLFVRPAQFALVNITAKVVPATGVVLSQLRSTIIANLARFFRVLIPAAEAYPGTELEGLVPNPLINFGYYMALAANSTTAGLAYSDMYNVVRDSSGVQRILGTADGFLVNGSHADALVNLWEFPALGTVTLIHGITGRTF